MSKRLFQVLAAAGLVAVLASAAVPAQAAEIKVRIPFDFAVNGKTLPAGVYTMSTQFSALFVRGANQGAIVLVNSASSTNTDAKAVFEKYGDMYYLREAWLGGGTGRVLHAPKVDRDRKASVERIEVPVL